MQSISNADILDMLLFVEERFNAKVDVVSLTAIMRSLFRNHIEKDAIYI